MLEAGWSVLVGVVGAVASLALMIALVFGYLGIGSAIVRLYWRIRYPHGFTEIRVGSASFKVANPGPRD